jgi:hypothetical protein
MNKKREKALEGLTRIAQVKHNPITSDNSISKEFKTIGRNF